MGKDMSCSVVGIGSITIRMHDGTNRTLTDIRHVLDLKKNLISLGMLVSKCFKYNIEDGVIRVTMGALLVMKGIKKGSFHVLEGNIMVGTTSVQDFEIID